MTIQELVEIHGLPVKVQPSKDHGGPPFTVHTETDDSWLVDYKDNPNHRISHKSLNAYGLFKEKGT